jgi:hypothetical protein
VSSTRNAGQVLIGLYIVVVLVLFIWLPLIRLHGYRIWWVDLFYGTFAVGIVGGVISHYRAVRQPPN